MPPTSLYARLTEMHRSQGMTYAAIGKVFDVAASTVQSRLRPRHQRKNSNVSDVCHGDCGRWIEKYGVGVPIVKPPDHCGACARAISPEAKAAEDRRVVAWYQAVKQAAGSMETE